MRKSGLLDCVGVRAGSPQTAAPAAILQTQLPQVIPAAIAAEEGSAAAARAKRAADVLRTRANIAAQRAVDTAVSAHAAAVLAVTEAYIFADQIGYFASDRANELALADSTRSVIQRLTNRSHRQRQPVLHRPRPSKPTMASVTPADIAATDPDPVGPASPQPVVGTAAGIIPQAFGHAVHMLACAGQRQFYPVSTAARPSRTRGRPTCKEPVSVASAGKGPAAAAARCPEPGRSRSVSPSTLWRYRQLPSQ